MDEKVQALPEDAELISRAQGGEVEAFGELYKRYLDPIYRYIRVRVSEDLVAEDLTEVVFLRSFERLDRYKELGLPFSAFLYRVARNLLVDHYRKQPGDAPLEVTDRLELPEPALEEQVIKGEHIQAAQKALASLPADYQEVIRLRVILDLPTATTADWIGKSEGAVRVLLHRALKALRARVSESDG
jgi:RNA polymerase sigma-70 factor (ECF subfamily)